MVEKRRFDESGRSQRKQELQIKMRDFRRLISNPALNPNVLEPFLRKVVREELDRALPPFFPPCPRPSLDQAGTSGVRSLQLHFVNQLPPFVFTDNTIETEDGAPIGIELIDTKSRTVVRSGPLSSLKIDIVVLDGDFGSSGQEDWTEHEFNANIQRERQGRRPLLVGDRTVTLLEGVGYIGGIHFTDNSSWLRSQKFRLGAIAARKSSDEVKIREARSEAFRVKDHRGELNKKHKIPSLGDEIWRLNKIARDGKRYNKLVSSGIRTVDDLLLQYAMNPSNIQKLFSRFSPREWESIIKHAMTCVVNDDRLSTYHSAGESVSLHFNSIYQVIGATFDGQNYCPVATLTSDQKHVVEFVKQEAYGNLKAWVPFNDMSTVSFSTPPGDAQHGPFAFAGPEQDLVFDLPVTYQGISPICIKTVSAAIFILEKFIQHQVLPPMSTFRRASIHQIYPKEKGTLYGSSMVGLLPFSRLAYSNPLIEATMGDMGPLSDRRAGTSRFRHSTPDKRGLLTSWETSTPVLGQ